MRRTPFLDAWGDDRPAASYLVRLWMVISDRPGHWATQDWVITEAPSVVEVIAWAREHSVSGPAEVCAVGEAGEIIHLWGDEPDDAATSVDVELHHH